MESYSVLQPIPPTIARLTGPLLIGYLLNWGLFGVLTVQCYIYYLAFPKDRLLIKSLVVCMFMAELVQTVLCTRDGFREFGSGWGYLPILDDVGWLWFSIPFTEAIVSCIFQLFYAWRIWVLGRSVWVPTTIVLLSALQGVTGIYTAVFANLQHHVSQFQDRSFKPTSIWLSGAALCDMIIALSMLYYFHRAKNEHSGSTTKVTKTINVSVQTGVICATFAILHLILFLATPKQNYYFAPTLILSKLYSNSLLVIFNARMRLSGGRNSGLDDVILSATSFESAVSFQSFRARAIGITSSHGTVPINGISVEVSQRCDVESEIEPGNEEKSLDMMSGQRHSGPLNDLTEIHDTKYSDLA